MAIFSGSSRVRMKVEEKLMYLSSLEKAELIHTIKSFEMVDWVMAKEAKVDRKFREDVSLFDCVKHWNNLVIRNGMIVYHLIRQEYGVIISKEHETLPTHMSVYFFNNETHEWKELVVANDHLEYQQEACFPQNKAIPKPATDSTSSDNSNNINVADEEKEPHDVVDLSEPEPPVPVVVGSTVDNNETKEARALVEGSYEWILKNMTVKENSSAIYYVNNWIAIIPEIMYKKSSKSVGRKVNMVCATCIKNKIVYFMYDRNHNGYNSFKNHYRKEAAKSKIHKEAWESFQKSISGKSSKLVTVDSNDMGKVIFIILFYDFNSLEVIILS